ncbi:hypothetical protein SNEBB_003285 [Seison nebaliae]|nr:hypothetical protein SNEBB_003285 [Seison nebaliae]
MTVLNELEQLMNQRVLVLCCDGQIFIGELKGFDQFLNLILNDCMVRVFSLDRGVNQISLGLYIIRGDNVAAVNEIDGDVDERIDWSQVKAENIPPIVHMNIHRT